MFEIMERDVDRRVAKIRISLPIPNRVHKGRFMQERCGHIAQKRVGVFPTQPRYLFLVPVRAKLRMRITGFLRAVLNIMHERIYPGRNYIRVLPEVKIRIKKRTGITPFCGAMFEIMARDVDRRVAKIRISLPIPNRVHQGRFVQDIDFFGEALGGFGAPRERHSENAHSSL